MDTTTPHLIGLHGYTQECRNDVAELLQPFGFDAFSIGENVREALYLLDPPISATVSLQGAVDHVGWEELLRHRFHGPEIARLLQQMEQAACTVMGGDIWLSTLGVDIHNSGGTGPHHPIVVTDVSQVKHARWILDRGGVIWNVEQPRSLVTSFAPGDLLTRPDLYTLTLRGNGDLEYLSELVAGALSAPAQVA